MYDYTSMGDRMLMARMKNKIKQKTIADALGITQPSYSNIESGKTEVTINQLHIIADLLHVPAIWLMGYDGISGLSDDEALKMEEYKKYLISQRIN
jgi:transcriptional regulator with XRE-family HTH domain